MSFSLARLILYLFKIYYLSISRETDLQINDAKKYVDELKEEIIFLEKRPSSLKGDSNKFQSIEENEKLLSELHNMESEKLR